MARGRGPAGGMGMGIGRRRWCLALSLAVLVAGGTYGGRRLRRDRRYRTALEEIREQIRAGRHGVASRNLAAVLEWEPGSDEAAYLLGLCERARGRIDAVRAVWDRIRPDSPFAVPAILGRALLESD